MKHFSGYRASRIIATTVGIVVGFTASAAINMYLVQTRHIYTDGTNLLFAVFRSCTNALLCKNNIL